MAAHLVHLILHRGGRALGQVLVGVGVVADDVALRVHPLENFGMFAALVPTTKKWPLCSAFSARPAPGGGLSPRAVVEGQGDELGAGRIDGAGHLAGQLLLGGG